MNYMIYLIVFFDSLININYFIIFTSFSYRFTNYLLVSLFKATNNTIIVDYFECSLYYFM